MQYGISTACLYPMETEHSLDLLLRFGYKRFELFVNASSELQRSFLKELKNQAESAGATFCSMHPYTCAIEGTLFFGDYPRRLSDGIDFYKKYFEAAAFLGASIFVLHGQKATREKTFLFSDELYCERYLMLAEAAASFGITLCQENVFGFRSQSIEFIQKMNQLLGDSVHFVFDLKQTITAKQDSIQMLKSMGKHLRHVHLSDNTSSASCLLPGKGNFDIKGLLNHLQEIGFDGTLVTEVYRSSYGSPEEILETRPYLESLLSDYR